MTNPVNGKTGELIRWVMGLVLAGLISYFTAIGAIQKDLAEAKATEDSHFSEVLRRLDVMQDDIRELRKAAR